MGNADIKEVILNKFVITSCDKFYEEKRQGLVWEHNKKLTLVSVVMESSTVEIIIKLSPEGKTEEAGRWHARKRTLRAEE